MRLSPEEFEKFIDEIKKGAVKELDNLVRVVKECDEEILLTKVMSHSNYSNNVDGLGKYELVFSFIYPTTDKEQSAAK